MKSDSSLTHARKRPLRRRTTTSAGFHDVSPPLDATSTSIVSPTRGGRTRGGGGDSGRPIRLGSLYDTLLERGRSRDLALRACDRSRRPLTHVLHLSPPGPRWRRRGGHDCRHDLSPSWARWRRAWIRSRGATSKIREGVGPTPKLKAKVQPYKTTTVALCEFLGSSELVPPPPPTRNHLRRRAPRLPSSSCALRARAAPPSSPLAPARCLRELLAQPRALRLVRARRRRRRLRRHPRRLLRLRRRPRVGRPRVCLVVHRRPFSSSR